MDIITGIIMGALPSFVLGIIGYRINRKADVRYEQHQAEKKERAEADYLLMEMVQAGADLSYACAMAIKRGEPNGEIEAGAESYEKAKARYTSYIRQKFTESQNGL